MSGSEIGALADTFSGVVKFPYAAMLEMVTEAMKCRGAPAVSAKCNFTWLINNSVLSR
jgi:hypothetical protein